MGDDGVDFFGAGDLDEAGDEFATEAGSLDSGRRQGRRVRLLRVLAGAMRRPTATISWAPRLGIAVVDDEGDFAVVVDAAAADQVFVSDP